MAELIVAGLAVASTPPALFALERLNDALNGKSWPEKQERKPKLGEAEDTLPNLLKPKNVVRGNAGKKEDQKTFLGEAKDALPNSLKQKNVTKGNAGEKEGQRLQPGEARVVCKPKNVLKGHEKSKVSLVSEQSSPRNSSRSTTTAETEPESPFSIDSIVQQDANNPYLLKIPSGHRIEQDASNPYLLKIPSGHGMEHTHTQKGLKSIWDKWSPMDTHRSCSPLWTHIEQGTCPIIEEDVSRPYPLKVPSGHHTEIGTSSLVSVSTPFYMFR